MCAFKSVWRTRIYVGGQGAEYMQSLAANLISLSSNPDQMLPEHFKLYLLIGVNAQPKWCVGISRTFDVGINKMGDELQIEENTGTLSKVTQWYIIANSLVWISKREV